MNAKYALALILTLQVSMSLCELPTPSAELAAKYDELKSTFFKRLLTAYKNLQANYGPMIENSEGGTVARDKLAEIMANPKFNAAIKILTGVAGEATHVVDKARSAALGLYEENLREYLQLPIENGINNIKFVLDKLLPVE